MFIEHGIHPEAYPGGTQRRLRLRHEQGAEKEPKQHFLGRDWSGRVDEDEAGRARRAVAHVPKARSAPGAPVAGSRGLLLGVLQEPRNAAAPPLDDGVRVKLRQPVFKLQRVGAYGLLVGAARSAKATHGTVVQKSRIA